MRPLVAAAVALATLPGCAVTANSRDPPQIVTIEYDVFDQPERGRFELRFKNETPNDMCIMEGAWPNAIGKLNQMHDKVYVEVEGRRYPVENFNVGFGTDNGLLRVPPGGKVVGYLAYADFDLPPELQNAPKRLELKPPAYICP